MLLYQSICSSLSCWWWTEFGPDLPPPSGVVTDVSVVTAPDEIWPQYVQLSI